MTAWCGVCRASRPHDELGRDHQGHGTCPVCGTRIKRNPA